MGKYNPTIHHRHSIRLKGYDYSRAGFYFMTMNTQNRLQLFGKIQDGVMLLSPAGEMVQQIWQEIPQFYKRFELHDYIVMPDHFHAILVIKNEESLVGADAVGAGPRACPINQKNPEEKGQPESTGQPQGAAQTIQGAAQTVGDLIARFKSLTTYKYIQGVRQDGWPPFEKRLWQRNYYEHIIRSERAYHIISAYIRNNPARWWEKQGK
jgi:REP element-mobilizing transposase RayT